MPALVRVRRLALLATLLPSLATAGVFDGAVDGVLEAPPSSSATGDIDGDGFTDLIVVEQRHQGLPA